MITPIAPSYNRNQTSFGMAFNKPDQCVMKKFREAVSMLNPEERKKFVDEVNKIVESQKNNPVNIDSNISTTGDYMAITRGNAYYDNSSRYHYQRILNTMRSAAKEADNQNNIDANMAKLNEVFNIKA